MPPCIEAVMITSYATGRTGVHIQLYVPFCPLSYATEFLYIQYNAYA